MRTADVTAVHEDDALALLDLLGVAGEYRSGDLVCSVCGTSLLENGLGAVRRADDALEFACGRLDCLEEFHAS
jgi:hypothetical protein